MGDGSRVAPSYDVIKSLKSGDQLPKPSDLSHLNLRWLVLNHSIRYTYYSDTIYSASSDFIKKSF